MTRLEAIAALTLALFAFAGCTGATQPAGNPPDNGLGQLEFTLTTDPGSPVEASEVQGGIVPVDDALESRQTSALPSPYQALWGMHFTPEVPLGAGFRGRIRLLRTGVAQESLDGVLLFLFYIDPATQAPLIMDTARGEPGGWLEFDITALGFFVVAENTSIPRPANVFTVSGFADMASTTGGTDITFWAVSRGGNAPITLSWDFGDGDDASGEMVTHAYAAPGEYSVVLSATDAAGNTAPTFSTPIEITTYAAPISAVAVQVVQDPADGMLFTYYATISGGQAPFTYEWEFEQGVPSSTNPPPVTNRFFTPGVYQGLLTITDSLGATGSGTFTSDARAPVITDVVPRRASVGDSVTITGQEFGTQEQGNMVLLAESELPVVSWADTEVVVTIPAAAEDGDIVVVKRGRSNAIGFHVIPPTPAKPQGGQI
jgi:PKD repeat protein